MLNTASSAVSNVVPFGGAVGVGATYGMCRSWGFGVPDDDARPSWSRASGTSSSSSGLPVIALVLLVAEGRATGGLVGAAIFGLAVLVSRWSPSRWCCAASGWPQIIGRWLQRLVSAGAAPGPSPRPPRDPRGRARLPPSQQRPDLAVLAAADVLDAHATRCCSSSCSCCACACSARPRWPPSRCSPPSPSAACCPPSRSPRAASGFADATVIGALVAFGGDPAICTAGVLLFTGFTYPAGDPGGGHLVGGVEPDASWRHQVAPTPGAPRRPDRPRGPGLGFELSLKLVFQTTWS